MNLPHDYVSPAERLGKLYDYQANHYRFQRQPQGAFVLERKRHRRLARIVVWLGVVAAIIAAVLA